MKDHSNGGENRERKSVEGGEENRGGNIVENLGMNRALEERGAVKSKKGRRRTTRQPVVGDTTPADDDPGEKKMARMTGTRKTTSGIAYRARELPLILEIYLDKKREFKKIQEKWIVAKEEIRQLREKVKELEEEENQAKAKVGELKEMVNELTYEGLKYKLVDIKSYAENEEEPMDNPNKLKEDEEEDSEEDPDEIEGIFSVIGGYRC